MNPIQRLAIRATLMAQHTWREFKEDERGEGLVSFLIIAVAVAALALFVLDVFQREIETQVGDLDLGDPPTGN